MTGKSSLTLTREQKLAVQTTGKSLLVSAAAGSGKTAVLAERCAYLVCKKDGCDIDELLVVTFTEAAAAEMKSRIARAIREAVGKQPSNTRLQRQLALIDRAQVSTLHAFCARLIRRHFHLLGLDPAFSVLDGDEAALLRAEIARQLFADRYERDADGKFQAFIDAYGDGKDERFIHQVIQAHEMLSSLVDPAAWSARALDRVNHACSWPLEDSELGKELLTMVSRRLDDLLKRCRDAHKTLSRQREFARYAEQLTELGRILHHWQDVLRDHGYDALCEMADFHLPRLPSLSSALPGKEAAKTLMESVRDELKTGGLRAILRFNTDLWIAGMKSTRDPAAVFLSLVEEFGERYRREKDATRAVDFSDLERLALRALHEAAPAKTCEKNRDGDGFSLRPSAVARLLHKQFRHVLVDEYQDINEVQDAILSLASTECLQSPRTPPNLFTVGDVKQSIYRFRLAEPHRFLARHQRFRNSSDSRGQVIDLQSNFRSRKPLLGALNEVFRRLMTSQAVDIEYDASHYLNPGLRYPDENSVAFFKGSPLELHLLPPETAAHDEEPLPAVDEDELGRSEREALLVARRILTLIGRDGSPPMHVMEKQADGSLAPRPIRLGDIVILLRSMRYKADQFADILRASAIPVHSESGTGYFDSMEVRDVLALLKVLDNRRQDIPLAAVLRSPLASLPDAEDALARIHLAYPALQFHEAAVRYPAEKDDELAAALQSLLKRLDRWRDMAQRRPLAELLWDIYDSTGYLAFCAGLVDGQQRVANLIDLHDRARQFGSFQKQGLGRFLDFLDSLQSESDLGQPPIVSGAEDVVRIMSIHRSKGLEFPAVILPDLGKAFNLSDCSGSILVDRHAYLGLSAIDPAKQIRYPSLASMLVETRLRQQSLAEELRVLYVAMTRAKEHLILVGTCSDSKIQSWATRFAGYEGAFSADVILSARTMLDWIGPVSAATAGGAAGGTASIFDIHRYAPDEVAAWPGPQALRPQTFPRQERLAKLEPLVPAPPADPVAESILARLGARYEFEAFSEVAAAESASSIAKGGREGGDFGFWNSDFGFQPAISTPKSRISAADIGSATHLLLEHLDFSKPCDPDDLRRQLQRLIDRRLIARAAADSIDLDSICWLAASPVGALLRDHAADLHREIPIYFARNADNAPAPASPLDRVMIRSRLDVLVRTSRGFEIIDYKTDRVTAETVANRVEFYRPQMDLYREALQALLGQTPAAIHVVFLVPRIIHTL